MADHTGGPWTVHFKPFGCEIIGWEDGEGIPVARCEATMTTHGITPWRANAFIITAAPEMLQALQAVARLHPGCDIRRTNITHSDACAQVQSAIAKATGGNG